MKRYLIIFINGKEFGGETIEASNIKEALSAFFLISKNYNEIFSITLVN